MQLIKEVACNMMGRDFIVGDIHGHFETLQLLLKEVIFDPSKDRLFAVGDLVDRGPSSASVLQWLIKPWFYSVMGNHEFMLLNAVLYNNYKELHQSDKSGGGWLYLLPLIKQQAIAEAFRELPYVIVIELATNKETIALLHANVPCLGENTSWSSLLDSLLGSKGVKEQKNILDELLWGRSRIKQQDSSPIEGIGKIYVGHTPVPRVTKLGQIIYMDTGAGKAEGLLSLLDIKCNKVYYCATDSKPKVDSYILE